MKKTFTDIDLNRSVGNLLRLGVILSVTTTLIGFAKLFLEGYKMPKNFSGFDIPTGERVWFHFWTSLQQGDAIGIIQLGILCLVFTPLVRIIFALVGYLRERDYTYVIISLIVLTIMIISFLTGNAH